MKHLRTFAWQLLIVGLLIYPASAEVMDKEPTISRIWGWAISGAMIGFLACRYRPLLAFITFPLASYFLFGVITEVLDPTVGPAIRLEAGSSYGFQVYAALGLVILGHIFGVILNKWKLKRS